MAGGGAASLMGVIAGAEAAVARGEPGTAVALYEGWLALHPRDPVRHVALFNAGVLLGELGRDAEAAARFAQAVEAQPGFLAGLVNGGLALERLGRPGEAALLMLRAADQVAGLGGEAIVQACIALRHLARMLKAGGEIGQAEEALRRCLELDPSAVDAVQHWVALRQMQCAWPAVAACGRVTEGAVEAAMSPLSLMIERDDPFRQLGHTVRCYRRDVARGGVGTAGGWVPGRRRPGPLRVGYVSPDLRSHAVGYLTAELFELHNPARVEVFAYESGGLPGDAVQARIRRAVPHWRPVAGLDARAAARVVLADEIDVLVDLAGYTAGGAPGLFALRPAPVLVNWLGYPGTVGTPHHHYIIADPVIVPPSHEVFYSERVVRLPCYQPTDRRRAVDAVPGRAAVGLPADGVVFCCFNGTQKITPLVFSAWMAILRAVPGSVLWLLGGDAATQGRLRARAVAAGVAGARLVFAPRLENAAHLARYRLADLFLDTWPYGAHTTASDALWMGVPVLTIAGEGFAARVCASLVSAAGLPELVCADMGSYEAMAVRLGRDPEALSGWRARLTEGRETCVLFDMDGLVARLELLYGAMWEEFETGALPDPRIEGLEEWAAAGDGAGDAAVLGGMGERGLWYRTAVGPKGAANWRLEPVMRGG